MAGEGLNLNNSVVVTVACLDGDYDVPVPDPVDQLEMYVEPAS